MCPTALEPIVVPSQLRAYPEPNSLETHVAEDDASLGNEWSNSKDTPVLH